jgi:heme exporter protein A
LTAKYNADRLTLVRGDRCLFKEISFSLDPGELLLLEGPNGSGKTSLLKLLAGLLDAESGQVSWNGVPAAKQRAEYCAALAWMGHRTGFKADLSPLDNLRFESKLRPVRTTDIDEVLECLGILRLRKLPMRALSAGQQRRVALARMLLSSAELWLMDEPYTNLDRAGRALVDDIVAAHLARDGLCVMAGHHDVVIDAPTKRLTLA